jgi:ABC-type nickel/cobalt efflux system permease component RcnA
MDIKLAGALAVVVMGLGTAALTSLVAISSTTARRMAVLSSGSMHAVATMLPVLQILVGVLILLFSLGLLGVALPLRS